MLVQEKKKSKLGRYVFIALILGLILSSLTRFFITDAGVLKYIAAQLDLVSLVFIRLIQMIIGPLVFSTLVVGISKLNDNSSIGRMFLKTMSIFIIGSVIALTVGLIIVDFFEPGVIFGKDLLAQHQHLKNNTDFANASSRLSLKNFVTTMIPSSVMEGFASNHIIQIVVFAMFFGVAGIRIGKRAEPIFNFFDLFSQLMFRVTNYVMLFAPFAVFAAVSTVIIKNGFGILAVYGVYIIEFVVAVSILWIIMIGISYLILGKSVFQLLKALADSLGIAFSTSSSESVLPNVFEELNKFGIDPRISGFVLPMGYSFNLVASTLNCIFATMFIVQSYGYHLSISQKITMCLILMVASKGIAGVPRASLVIVAATLASVGIPEAAVLLLFPIDGFLDMLRSATNVFGNALSATIVNKWEKRD